MLYRAQDGKASGVHLDCHLMIFGGGGGVGINNYSSTTLILVFQVPKYS